MVDTSITLKVIRERAPEIAELRPCLHWRVEIWVLPRGGKTGAQARLTCGWRHRRSGSPNAPSTFRDSSGRAPNHDK